MVRRRPGPTPGRRTRREARRRERRRASGLRCARATPSREAPSRRCARGARSPVGVMVRISWFREPAVRTARSTAPTPQPSRHLQVPTRPIADGTRVGSSELYVMTGGFAKKGTSSAGLRNADTGPATPAVSYPGGDPPGDHSAREGAIVRVEQAPFLVDEGLEGGSVRPDAQLEDDPLPDAS